MKESETRKEMLRLRLQLKEERRRKMLRDEPDESISPDCDRIQAVQVEIDPFERAQAPGIAALLEQREQARILENIRQQAAEGAAEFVEKTPEYHPCQANLDSITQYVIVNQLRPTADNFRLAFDRLSAEGALYTKSDWEDIQFLEKPEPEPAPVAEHESTPEPKQEVPVDLSKYTQETIDKMTSQEFLVAVKTIPGFKTHVDTLYSK